MDTEQVGDERQAPPGSHPVPPSVEDLRLRAMSLERRARSVIEKRPIVSVAIAVGVGYLAARVVSRATRRAP